MHSLAQVVLAMVPDLVGQLRDDDALVARQLPARAVGEEDKAELEVVDDGRVMVGPVEVLPGEDNLGAAGGEDSPAEALLGGEGRDPVQVSTEKAHGLHQQALEVAVHLLAAGTQLRHHLTSQHIQHQQLEVVALVGDGALCGCVWEENENENGLVGVVLRGRGRGSPG